MDKRIFYIAGSLGMTIGGYLPTLLGANGFSIWSVIGGLVGGIGFILIALRISN